MEIKRDIYLNKLINIKHNGLIKVVTGIRRCGKSYLLFNLQRFSRIIEQMKASEGVTEDLKTADQMAWVGAMDSIQNRVEEIDLQELIYGEEAV